MSDWERVSFENLVRFVGAELRRIVAGEETVDVFPERSFRRTLRKHGVLCRSGNYGASGGSRSTVSERAKEVLGVD